MIRRGDRVQKCIADGSVLFIGHVIAVSGDGLECTVWNETVGCEETYASDLIEPEGTAMDETFEDVLEDIVADIRLGAMALSKLNRHQSARYVQGIADRIELGRYKGAAGRLRDALRADSET